MGYNVLSGNVSVTHLTSVSGSFTGDGSGLENVKQFELQNAGVAKIPFYKTIDGELGLNANDSFTFNASTTALTVPALTSSVGINLSNPISGTLASTASYLGLDANGNIVVTSSMTTFSRVPVTVSLTATVGPLIFGVSASSEIQISLLSAASYINGQHFTVKDEGGNCDVHNITIKCLSKSILEDYFYGL